MKLGLVGILLLGEEMIEERERHEKLFGVRVRDAAGDFGCCRSRGVVGVLFLGYSVWGEPGVGKGSSSGDLQGSQYCTSPGCVL